MYCIDMDMRPFLLFVYLFGCSHGEGRCRKSVTTVLGTHAPEGVICSGDLIFDENFDELDRGVWQHERSLGHVKFNEFEWYDDDSNNSYVKEGSLHIRPTLTSDKFGEDFLYSGVLNIKNCTSQNKANCCKHGNQSNIINPIISARVNTNNSFAFKYGKIEARIKAPAGDWLWPAFWMMPKDPNAYVNWPQCGEVDIYESRGNRNFVKDDADIGVQRACSTLHWGPSRTADQYKLTDFHVMNQAGFDKEFHRFQMQWTPDNITFSLDDRITGVIILPDGGFWELGDLDRSGYDNPWKYGTKMAPFDKEFFFIINVAVGGTSFFSDYAKNYPVPKPWMNNSTSSSKEFWEARNQWLPGWNMNTDESHMQVDYVRVWAI